MINRFAICQGVCHRQAVLAASPVPRTCQPTLSTPHGSGTTTWSRTPELPIPGYTCSLRDLIGTAESSVATAFCRTRVKAGLQCCCCQAVSPFGGHTVGNARGAPCSKYVCMMSACRSRWARGRGKHPAQELERIPLFSRRSDPAASRHAAEPGGEHRSMISWSSWTVMCPTIHLK